MEEENVRPLTLCFTSSFMLSDSELKNQSYYHGRESQKQEQKKKSTHQANSSAQTGNPQPNISTIFIGRSAPEVLVCKETPRSADPARKQRLATDDDNSEEEKGGQQT